MKRSARVDLPWSMCAMIEKLRMFCMREKWKRPPGTDSVVDPVGLFVANR
jgi:hypothetical protein